MSEWCCSGYTSRHCTPSTLSTTRATISSSSQWRRPSPCTLQTKLCSLLPGPAGVVTKHFHSSSVFHHGLYFTMVSCSRATLVQIHVETCSESDKEIQNTTKPYKMFINTKTLLWRQTQPSTISCTCLQSMEVWNSNHLFSCCWGSDVDDLNVLLCVQNC